MTNALKHKTKTIPEVLTSWKNLSLKCNCLKKDSEAYKNNELFNILIEKADQKIKDMFDIVKLFKNMDEIRFLKKLILNENQLFMLKNMELNPITDIAKEGKDVIDQRRKANLVDYLKMKNKTDLIGHEDDNVNQVDNVHQDYLADHKGFDKTDFFLLEKLNDELKTEIRKELSA